MPRISETTPEVLESQKRRRILMAAASGTAVLALGAVCVIRDNDAATRAARAETLPDGRPRLPPGQRVIKRLKPMGGRPGSPAKSSYTLKIHGLVEHPTALTFSELLEQPQVETELDVHCVTGWSMLDAGWKGVSMRHLAELAGVKDDATHVILEAAKGYTANLPLDEFLDESNLVAHRHEGKPLAQPHGAPVRAVVPKLYFWKSAKWLTGIRFTDRDIPGYWEIRGYHNHADPWTEERYG